MNCYSTDFTNQLPLLPATRPGFPYVVSSHRQPAASNKSFIEQFERVGVWKIVNSLRRPLVEVYKYCLILIVHSQSSHLNSLEFSPNPIPLDHEGSSEFLAPRRFCIVSVRLVLSEFPRLITYR